MENETVKMISVDSIEVRDGQIIWNSAASEAQLNLSTILFVWGTSRGGKHDSYVVCCLKEDSHQGQPFELILISSKSIPDQLLRQHLLSDIPAHLPREIGEGLSVVVSAKSGTGQALTFWQRVLQPLFDLIIHGPDVSATAGGITATPHRVLITQNVDSVSLFARSLWSQDQATPKTIVMLSGDGGVVDLLNGCDGAPLGSPLPAVALIPMGTGNALFHSLHKPLYTPEGPSPLVLSLQSLFRGSTTDLPAFRASFSSGSRAVIPSLEAEAWQPVSHLNGAIVASYGFHASVVYESDTAEYRKHGDKRFGMVAQELLREAHPYTAYVEVRRPGHAKFVPIERDTHAYVLATMVSNLERAFAISPDSKPLDGKLRLVHFAPLDGERVMDVMMKAYDGGKHIGLTWDDGEKVWYEEIEEVKVTVQEDDARYRKVCIDGTIVDLPKGGEMTVSKLESSGLRIVVSTSVLQD